MMHSILFTDTNRNGLWRDYSKIDLQKTGGVQRNTLTLARALADRGHTICITTGSADFKAEALQFISQETASTRTFDFIVANNFASAFKGLRSRHRILWIRNPPLLWKTVRDDYVSKLVFRPHAVHLSKYTTKGASLLPFKSNRVIPHGVADEVASAGGDALHDRKKVALFASTPDRNLNLVIQSWIEVVHQHMPDAELHVCSDHKAQYAGERSADELRAFNIHFLGRQPQSMLFESMKAARLIFIPGHREETFCNLASEAMACGLPILTMGMGALGERVQHGSTGLVVSNVKDMGTAAVQLFGNDALWESLHQGCLSSDQIKTWKHVASMWEDAFGDVRRTLPTPHPDLSRNAAAL